MNSRPFTLSILVLFSMVLIACTPTKLLSPTPTLYTDVRGFEDDHIPQSQRTTSADMYYFTDRQPWIKNGALGYGFERSPSMAFGRSRISFEGVENWTDLIHVSQTANRPNRVRVEVQENKEHVRFEPSPYPVVSSENGLRTSPDVQRMISQQKRKVRREVASQLAQVRKKEVIVFVHGVANSFEDGVQSLTNIWHFSERHGVPVLFSWPSSNPGITGYFRDAESGDYSVFHFKEFIRTLSGVPGLERIHIVAHSHGAEIVTTGLRELLIEERARGGDANKEFKIANLILAAPDLDFGVVQQRLMAEHFGPAVGRISVYTNPGDGALSLAQRILSGKRFGRLTSEDLTGTELEILQRAGNVAFIRVESTSGKLGHSYFRNSPEVLSDIALTITQNADPGSTQRPLRKSGGLFWVIEQGYPY